MRGNCHEPMTVAEVLVSEADLFRPEQQGYSGCCQRRSNKLAGIVVQALRRLRKTSIANRCCSYYQSAVADRFRNALELLGIFENIGCVDSGAGFPEGEAVRVNDPQAMRAEVSHGASSSADI